MIRYSIISTKNAQSLLIRKDMKSAKEVALKDIDDYLKEKYGKDYKNYINSRHLKDLYHEEL